MSSNYQKLYDKDYGELQLKYDQLFKENKALKLELNDANKMIKALTEKVNKLMLRIEKLIESDQDKTELIEKLLAKIEQLMILIDKLNKSNNKDSNNSSKPSSTNGFKNTVVNRREKSNKKQGGQKGHEGHTLKEKEIKAMIKSGNFKHEIIEENKTPNSKSYKSRYVIDIEVNLIIKEYRDYSCETVLNPVTYGENIKTISSLVFDNYISTDGVVKFFDNISNGNIKLSKGIIINWENELSNKVKDDLAEIEAALLTSYYTNNDDSQIKIDGKRYNPNSVL